MKLDDILSVAVKGDYGEILFHKEGEEEKLEVEVKRGNDLGARIYVHKEDEEGLLREIEERAGIEKERKDGVRVGTINYEDRVGKYSLRTDYMPDAIGRGYVIYMRLLVDRSELEKEIELFKAGVKPAVMVSKNYLVTKGGKDLEAKYPYLVFPETKEVLFFQDIVGLANFTSKLIVEMEQQGTRILNSNSKMLGDTLGYPPLATDAWEKYFMHDAKNKMKKAKVNYYGMEFLCLPEDVDVCLEWLEENRPVPKAIKEKFEVNVNYV